MKTRHIIIAVILLGLIFLLKFTESDLGVFKTETTQDIDEIHEIQNEVFDLADEVIEESQHKTEELIHLDSLVVEKDMTIEEYSKKLESQLYKSEQARKEAEEMKEMAEEMSEMAQKMKMESLKQKEIAEHKYHSLREDYEKVLIELQECSRDTIPLTTVIRDTVYINKKKRN